MGLPAESCRPAVCKPLEADQQEQSERSVGVRFLCSVHPIQVLKMSQSRKEKTEKRKLLLHVSVLTCVPSAG